MKKIRIITICFIFLIVNNIKAQEPGAGYALNFDGTNDAANSHAGDLVAITDNFTIEFWARPTTTRTTKVEATTGITGTTGNGQRYAVYAEYGGSSNAGAGVSVGTNGVSVYEHGAGYMPALLVHDATLSGWNHIAVVYTSKQPSLYINGILVHTGLTSVRAAVFPGGRLGGDPYGYYMGELDEFRVWSTSRTQTQIRDNMCKKLIGNEVGLARYLRIDDGSGTTVTDATGTQNATMTNMVPASDWVISGASIGNTSIHQYASPFGGTALDFDGVNDRVDGYAVDLTTVTDNFTMELWVKPTGTITIQPQSNTGVTGTGTPNQRFAIYPEHGIVTAGAGDAGAGISVGTNGIQVYEHDGGYLPALASYSATISGWNHIAVVYTAKRPTIYLNGVAVHTGALSGKVVFPGAGIGGKAYGFYMGQIDDVRVWNYSRTPAQIANNVCAELSGTEPGLIRYYKLNTGSGTTAIDATGTNNGTLINMTPASDWVSTGAGTGPSCFFSGSLIHQSPELDSLGVSNISGTTKGIHIYHVDAVPNTTTGILGLGANDHYYGVFKAGVVTPTTYTATYYYDENDSWQSSSPYLNETDLALFTRSDNAVTSWVNVGAALNIGANTLTAPAQSTEFILGAENGISLPIELISFKAILKNQIVDLKWQTATEINNDYFTVEKSKDGFVWITVAEQPGAGNSNTFLNYNDVDLNPFIGVSYYRLKQTDYNGDYAYSNAISINNSEESINIYPNPVKDVLTINNLNETHIVKVFAVDGRIIFEGNSPALNTSKWSNGIYELIIFKQNGEIAEKIKIVK